MPDVATLLAAYDNHLRPAETARLDPGIQSEKDGPVVRVFGGHRGFVSAPNDLRMADAELDSLIARQRDFFTARGEAVEWKARSHDLPADLPERLAAAGFLPEEQETVVIGVAEELTDGPTSAEGVHIRRTTADADMHRIADMQTVVWNTDLAWLADDLIRRKDSAVVLVAEADGRVVSAAWMVTKYGKEFAGLWGGSTLAEWRGRGIYRALVVLRAQLAVELGIRYLQVDASDDSRPILERMGFKAVTTTTPYVWTPQSATAVKNS
ncbi:MAG: GNAT family N-acetyltransferase [Kibdelosporangium sp.]